MLRLLSFVCLLAFSLLSPPIFAQSAEPLVVMNLAAHPDDEDGRTLTYYRHAKDAVAYSVIFTRGEGGQNEIGPELYEALGAIRTEETERAARHLGTQVFFLNFYDFGFSKHASEAFEKWGGRDAVTARLVYLIRTLKPDVLFTNHDTVTVGPRRQHGQHQAVGLAAFDAMALAADPTYHPEQLEEDGVDLWQPKRLFLRCWQRCDGYDVALPIGTPDAATGRPYYARAVDAIYEHASQGMGQFAPRLRTDYTYFQLLRAESDAPLDSTDLAANLPPNTTAVPSLRYWADSGRLPPVDPEAFTLEKEIAVPGERVELRWDREVLPPRGRWIFSGAVDTTIYLSEFNPNLTTLRLRADAAPTLPKPVRQYDRFDNRPPLAYAVYEVGNDAPVRAGYLPLEIAPPLVVTTGESVMRLRPGTNRVPVEAQVYDPEATRVDLNVAVSHDASRSVIYQHQATLPFDATTGRGTDTLRLDLPARLAEGAYTVTLTALPSPTLRPRQPAHARLAGRVFEAVVPENLRVGVVRSYDDTLPTALRELGVEHVLLDSLDLAKGRFAGLHTIVVDIRAYLVRPDLRLHNDRLLDWVAQGGHLVVNYQKTFEWNPQYDDPFLDGEKNPDGFAPYPLRLSRDRIVDENAAIELLHPEHPLFHFPAETNDATWAGWVQERGLYFPGAYDERYRELFRANDPGEAPLTSSTLLAEYGDGTYLYTALVWYRQLKVFHPGVYQFFANMISLPLRPGS